MIYLQSAIAEGFLEVMEHKDRFGKYPGSFVACEFVDYLVEHKGKKRSQAVLVGQALLDAEYVIHVRLGETVREERWQ